MSNNPVQPIPVPTSSLPGGGPVTPAEIHLAEQRAQEWLKQQEDVPKLLSRKHLGLGGAMALLFLVITLPLTVLVVSQQKKLADVRSRAASQDLFKQKSNTVTLLRPQPVKSAVEYYKFIATYLSSPSSDLNKSSLQTRDISVPELQIKGVVYLKYDEKQNKTVIASRLEGLSSPGNQKVQVWLLKEKTYKNIGMVEFAAEPGGRTGYSVYSQEGNLENYNQLLFSYDTSTSVQKPELTIIKIDF